MLIARFLSSKFASQVNTIYGGAQLLVSGCLESMCHKFNSQGLGLRILELMIASPKSGGFNSKVPILRVPLRSQVSGSRVSGSRVSGLGSQVLILDYARLLVQKVLIDIT